MQLGGLGPSEKRNEEFPQRLNSLLKNYLLPGSLPSAAEEFAGKLGCSPQSSLSG